MTIDISLVPIEQWALSDIKLYANNNKKHPEKHIDLLSRLIAAQGLINPLTIEENGTIITGHGRFLAIQRLGWEKVPVRVLRGVSEDEARSMRISDNKAVSNDYDTDALARELALLSQGEFDMSLLGMEDRELAILIGDPGEINTDALVEDIDMAVGKHEADVEERAAAADGDTIRLDKAFGFKELPLPAQKTVTRFLATIEAETGLTGVDALVHHMKSVVSGS